MRVVGMNSYERFFRHVTKGSHDSECWLWHGGKMVNGYGVARKNAKEGLSGAHRVSWELFRGKIPKEKLVLHSCDVRACVNPQHLFLGNYKDNTRDMIAKRRNAKGERIGTSKLKERDIKAIRKLVKSGETRKSVAKKFGVSHSLISMVVLRQIWKHVP